jgi:hypothetical protein
VRKRELGSQELLSKCTKLKRFFFTLPIKISLLLTGFEELKQTAGKRNIFVAI